MASLSLMAVAFALAASPTLAATHKPEGGFGPDGTASTHFAEPAAVGVDQSAGTIYVADSFAGTVERFNSSHQPEMFTGVGVNISGNKLSGFTSLHPKESEIAADSTTHSFYVVDNGKDAIRAFQASGEPANFTAGTGAGTNEIGGFGELCGVAVDANGDIYAGDAKFGVDVFAPSGALLKAVPLAVVSGEEPCKLAVDSHGELYVDKFDHAVERLTPSEFPVTSSTTYSSGVVVNPEPSFGVAVDAATNDLFVSTSLPHVGVRVLEYSESGEALSVPFGSFFEAEGLAATGAAGAEHVYVADIGSERQVQVFGKLILQFVTEEASELEPTAAVLNGSVDPEEITLEECRFEYVEVPEYEPEAIDPYHAGAVVPCEQGAGTGDSPVPVSAHVHGLHPDTSYDFRLKARNANGTEVGANREFTSSGPGLLDSYVTDVTASSAGVKALIDPNNAATTYLVRYGRTTAYEEGTVPAEPAIVGTAKGKVSVEQNLTGLHAGTTYHVAVVALSEWAPGKHIEIVGPDHAFTTQPVGEFALPDGRQWEMVSSPDKEGSLILSLSAGGPVQAARQGGAISYRAAGPTESGPAGNAAGAQVLSTRTAGGWSSVDITVPHAEVTGLSLSFGPEARLFSEDLSGLVVQPFGRLDPAISSEATEQTPFLHTDYAGAVGSGPCTSSCFHPLVTAADDTAVPFRPFAEGGTCKPARNPCFQDATSDLSHVVMFSGETLTQIPAPEGGLYEWSAGRPPSEQLQLISLLPPNGEGKELPAVAPEMTVGQGSTLPSNARRAISADGSRVFWNAENHLFMRDTVSRRTLQLDVPESACLPTEGCGTGVGLPIFQAASASGSRAFFTDGQKLTRDAQAYAVEGGDLYEFDPEKPPDERLTDLAPAGAVLGYVPGVSEDGSWLYFVADGVLQNNGAPVPGAVHGTCTDAANVPEAMRATQACNLYVRHAGETRLVAVLSDADIPDWGASTVALLDEGKLKQLIARVSPDGRWFAFSSRRSLTGYDNRDAVSEVPDQEMYLYDGQTGSLVCASCNPTGARPRGVEWANMREAQGERNIFEPNTWVAANVPPWTANSALSALTQPRYLSDGGRLFFDAHEGLVPKDVNGTEDVYEYEPAGVPAGEHACSPSSASGSVVFKPEVTATVEGRKVSEGAGCVGLISSGSSVRESTFLDASEDGSDVFFLTAARLASQDVDEAFDVYDAHECSPDSPCVQPPVPRPPCSTEASCKPAPTPQPPIFGLPASATFSGPQNPAPPPSPKAETGAQKLTKALRACRRDRSKKKRRTCEASARRRYGAAKKPNHRTQARKGKARR